MKSNVIPVFIFLLFSVTALSKENRDERLVINGHIRDAENGEELIGATVYVKELATGTVTNTYGFYSLNLKPGTYNLVYSYMGFQNEQLSIDLNENRVLNIELKSISRQIEEVVVKADRPQDRILRPQMGVEKIEAKTIKAIPSLMGEVDVIKSIQLLPGVQSSAEGSTGFSVRGGGIDQNLILFDEAMVYNSAHLMGFFSVFNNDAVSNLTLYKGDIPARMGGRLSSVLDIQMKNGNSKEFHGNGGIGLVSSRLTLEGPVVKDKASYIVSARRSYYDIFLPLSNNEDVRDTRLYFYDLNAKVNYRINKNNRIFLSSYMGRDVFNSSFIEYGFGNKTFTGRWNHLFSENLFSNFSLIYSNYDNKLGTPGGGANSFEFNNLMENLNFKNDYIWYLNPSNTVRWGVSSIYHDMNPGFLKSNDQESIFNDFEMPVSYALEHAAYLSNEQKIGEFLRIRYGLRYSVFQNLGDATVYQFDENYEVIDTAMYEKNKIYNTYADGIEPRLSMTFIINPFTTVKASYVRTRQYVQLAQNSTAGTPMDFWFPVSPNVKPQSANQYSLGIFRNLAKNTVETSLEAYYKDMDNTIDFKDHANLLFNPEIEGELRVGTSKAYGLEFMTKINRRKLNGWISYTLSRSERTIPGINDGKTYLSPYDKTHDVSLVLQYKLSERWNLSANWIYATGNPVTFPAGRMRIENMIVPVFTERNAYRLPDYHRLDLGATYQFKHNPAKKWRHELNFSIYNVYNHKNAWAINFKEDEDNPDVIIAEKVYLFPIIPSITYNFKF